MQQIKCSMHLLGHLYTVVKHFISIAPIFHSNQCFFWLIYFWSRFYLIFQFWAAISSFADLQFGAIWLYCVIWKICFHHHGDFPSNKIIFPSNGVIFGKISTFFDLMIIGYVYCSRWDPNGSNSTSFQWIGF